MDAKIIKDIVNKHRERDKSLLTVYVMRHGRTALDALGRSDGWLDLPLTDDGRRGLIEAQQYLKDKPIEYIYAPGLKRTVETGHIIGSGNIHQPKLIVADEAKTWNLGVLTGTLKEPSKPIVMWFVKNPERSPLGGESLSDFRNRFLPWLENRKKDVIFSKKPILIVVSGSNLREISNEMCGNKDELDLNEGGMIALQYTNGIWKHTVIMGQENMDERVS